MPDLACIQYGPIASAATQVAIETFLQDVLCRQFFLLLAFGQGLMGSDNKARSAEAALRGAEFSKAICRQAIMQSIKDIRSGLGGPVKHVQKSVEHWQSRWVNLGFD